MTGKLSVDKVPGRRPSGWSRRSDLAEPGQPDDDERRSPAAYVGEGRGVKRLIAIAILVVGCAAPAASAPPSQALAPVAPTVVSTAAPAAAPTARPTAQSAAVRQTGHITLLVKSLMSKSDPQEIMAWIDNENQWLSEQATLPIVSDYRASVEAAAYDLRNGGKQNVIERHALEIIAAAREVPGVTLP